MGIVQKQRAGRGIKASRFPDGAAGKKIHFKIFDTNIHKNLYFKISHSDFFFTFYGLIRDL
jgi:hypothetical protein